MAQIFPQLPEISVAAGGDTPDAKIEALVRQLNEQIRLLNTAYSQFRSESYVPMVEWFGSYKLNSTYTTLNSSITTIDFDDWKGYSWYWENFIFTDIGTGYVRLFNVTDNEAVPGSETTTTAIGEANAEYSRTDILTKYDGVKEFVVQVKIIGGNGTSEYVNCMKSRMVFRINTQ